MTANEQATELYNKFYAELQHFGNHPRTIHNITIYCAIAACDKIMEVLESTLFANAKYLDHNAKMQTVGESTPIDYWQDVKKQLIKLK